MESAEKNDFVEIEFTGKSNGEIFDTTNPDEAKSIGIEADVKPIIVSIGNEMLLKGLDEYLSGKEIGKKYSLHLTPKLAFGPRNPSLVKLIPMRIFRERELTPYPGAVFQFDNMLAKVLSVSGGRITVDFNNPLAGKEIDYDFIIKRKVTDNNEKINALQDFFFKSRFDFEIKNDEAGKKVIFKKQEIKPFIDMFKDRFKEITGFDFEVEEKNKSKDYCK